MKKIAIILALFCLPLVLFAQSKQLEKAVKKGKHPQNKTYYVEFKKYYDMANVNDWIKRKGYNLFLSSTTDYPIFGGVKIGYHRVYFMSYPDYSAFVDNARRLAYEEKLKKQKEQQKNEESIFDLLVPAIIGGAVLFEAVEQLFSTGDSNNYSGSSNNSGNTSSSTQDKKPSNTTAGKSAPKACVTSEKEYGQAFLRCNAKVKDPYYEVKCGNGNVRYYYYIPVANTSGLCSDQVGYYQKKGFDLDIYNPGSYLGKDREKALKKLCGCE
jgi:hypothetical protein